MARKTNYSVNGKAYYRIKRKVGEDANGKSLFKTFYGEGKTEAEEKFKEYMEDLKNSPNANRRSSLGQLAKYYTYNVLINDDLAPGTIELYERQYRTKFAPSKLMLKPEKDISSADLQQFLNQLALGRLDGKDVKICLSALKALFKYLKKLFLYLAVEGYCQNVMSNVIRPNLKIDVATGETEDRSESDIDVFSPEEVQKILSAPNKKMFLFALALATGLREGELFGLKYEDFADKSLRVNKQVNTHYKIDSDGYRERITVVKKLKSKRSVRTVPVPEHIWVAFKRHEREHKSEMMRNGYRSDFIFTTDTGKFLDASDLRRAWQRHLKKVGVDFKKFHACRATYCVLLCLQGVPLETAAELMGHDSVDVTYKYYRYVTNSELKAAASTLQDIFSVI